jgi:hypothetical protein
MRTTRIRIAIATMAAALTVTVATSYAAAPHAVHVGSSGNAKLDDICRQMGGLINDEINEGQRQEENGEYGEANAWYNQASDHIARAQAAGCVMSIRVPPHVGGLSTGVAVQGQATRGTPAPTAGARKKKITGTATKGKGNLSQQDCSSFASAVNDALDHADQALANGDPDLAAGWRQHANDLLAAGRGGGCLWAASIRAGIQANLGSHASAVARR